MDLAQPQIDPHIAIVNAALPNRVRVRMISPFKGSRVRYGDVGF